MTRFTEREQEILEGIYIIDDYNRIIPLVNTESAPSVENFKFTVIGIDKERNESVILSIDDFLLGESGDFFWSKPKFDFVKGKNMPKEVAQLLNNMCTDKVAPSLTDEQEQVLKHTYLLNAYPGKMVPIVANGKNNDLNPDNFKGIFADIRGNVNILTIDDFEFEKPDKNVYDFKFNDYYFIKRKDVPSEISIILDWYLYTNILAKKTVL